MLILSFCFDHVEDNLVAFSHALSMRRADIVLYNDLPLPPTEPAAHETLYLNTHQQIRHKKSTHIHLKEHTTQCFLPF